MIITDYPEEILKALEVMPIKEMFIKIELLDWKENFLYEIQGYVKDGSISFDASSALRRTCQLNFIAREKDDLIDQFLSLNKKFRLWIGYGNKLPIKYAKYGEKFWFKMGIYVCTSLSLNHTLDGINVSISGQDKMCLLNGSVGGSLPSVTIFHEDGEFNLLPIYRIIYELVNHWGKEDIQNIFINDIPNEGRALMKYNGNQPIYLLKDEHGSFTGNYSFEVPEQGEFEMFSNGQSIGYKLTEFIFPGELVANVGASITSVLDNIVQIFSNYEYFYNVDGQFIFQEKRNYLNNSYIPITQIGDGKYEADFNLKETVYSFKNGILIASYSNNPRIDNIKNDFIVWGKKRNFNGSEVPIRYHLAVDNYPIPLTEEEKVLDFREILYQRDSANPSAASDYYMEMSTPYTDGEKETTEWRRLYENGDWTKWVKDQPEDLTYFLDFIDGSGQFAKYSVSSIGRRTYAIEDDKAVCIHPDNPPQIIYVTTSEDFQKYTELGYLCAMIDTELDSALGLAYDNKSCFDVLRELVYQKLFLQESISISSIPIFYLEPNDKIEVVDEEARIFGNFIIASMSIQLSESGLMSINATAANNKI